MTRTLRVMKLVGLIILGLLLAVLLLAALAAMFSRGTARRAPMSAGVPEQSMGMPAPMAPGMVGGAPGEAPGGGPPGPAAEYRAVSQTAEGTGDSTPAASDKPISGTGVAHAGTQRKLIRTAQMQMEVPDAEKFLRRAEVLARELGGFVSSTSLSAWGEGAAARSGTVTLRVPSHRFDDAVAQLRAMGRLESFRSGVQDVTAEYVDMEARIRNSQREEQQLLKLFERSGKLADIITVEEKLSEVRERIERLQSQMRALADQVGLSTITVTFHEKQVPLPQVETSTYSAIFHVRSAVKGLIRVLQGILTFFIYFFIVGWVVWGPLAVIVWVVVRQGRRTRARQAVQQAARSVQQTHQEGPGDPGTGPPAGADP